MKQNKGGFTLMETMIALAVMTVLITGFLAVFGPAANSVRKALTIDEVNRMQATLERELSTLRPGGDDASYGTSFEKAMDWITNSGTGNTAIILYKYRGNPGSTRADGTLTPVNDATGEVGKDFVIQPMARQADDPLLSADLEAVDGRAFFVTMRQLVYAADGSMELGPEDKIVDPNNTGSDHTGNSATYPEAVIAFQGSFYILPTVSIDFIQNNFNPDNFEKAAFVRNMAVRR
ncbi:MAG: PulJ/GspJ family protein [Verrucomicrobiales bacterium]